MLKVIATEVIVKEGKMVDREMDAGQEGEIFVLFYKHAWNEVNLTQWCQLGIWYFLDLWLFVRLGWLIAS